MVIDDLLEFFRQWSPAICGLLFTVGALIISETGKIFIGSIIYLCADLVYLIYALILGDTVGIILLLSGLVFGIRTLIKMNIGVFIKTLTKEKNNAINSSE